MAATADEVTLRRGRLLVGFEERRNFLNMEATAKLTVPRNSRLCTDDQMSRYSLGCIQCIPKSGGGAWLVATDGRKLTVMPVEGQCDRVHYLPASLIKRTERKRSRRSVIVSCVDGRWLTTDGRYADEPTDAKFPDVTAVREGALSCFPSVEDRVPVFINAKFLRQMAKSLTEGSDYLGVCLLVDRSGASTDANGMVGILADEGEGFGTLMAMGVSRGEEAFYMNPQRIYADRVQGFLADYRKAMEPATATADTAVAT